MEQMRAGIKLLSLVGIVLFLLILSRINLAGLGAIFAYTNPVLLLLALMVNGIAILLKAVKWRIIVNSVKPDFSLGESIKGFFVGFAFSTLTPAKIGDFIKVFYVKDDRCGMGSSLSTVVIDRLIDIVLLLAMALLGISIFAIHYRIEVLSLGTLILLVAGIAAGMYVMLNRRILSLLLRPFFDRFIPDPHKDAVSSYFDDFFQGLVAFSHDRPRFTWGLGMGIASWIPPFLYGYLLALSLGIELSPFFFVLVIPVLGLLDLLPISISGIGTRDIALIFLFGLRGISPEQAVAFSLLYLFTSYWLVALVGALLYLRYPIKIPGTGIRGLLGF